MGWGWLGTGPRGGVAMAWPLACNWMRLCVYLSWKLGSECLFCEILCEVVEPVFMCVSCGLAVYGYQKV